MKRSFLSLYFLIVTSVVTVGWGLDKLWQHYQLEPRVTPSESDLVYLVQQLLAVDGGFVGALPDELSRQLLHARIEVFPLDDLAQSQLAETVKQGSLAVIDTADGGKTIYKRLPNSNSVLALRTTQPDAGSPAFYDLFLVLFYASIALAVFFWVWPLSRDLHKLERQTRVLGKDRVPEDLSIRRTSPVYDLAAAFNRMGRRIKSLLASHKEMTYAVSHELRTPLARMKFGLEMAGECDDLPRLRAQLAGVKQDVSEMDKLINELLAYAGFEQSDQPLNLQPGDMRSLVEQLLLCAVDGKELKHEFTCTAPDARVVCEWYLMERAVLNLLQNAARFAKSQVLVTLDNTGGFYELCVDDDGPGIPEEEQSRVFNAFVRLSSQENTQARGFGLGLAIVKRVIEWHGGSVSALRAPTGGARLCLRWPLHTGI